jgi:hypothetical protein
MNNYYGYQGYNPYIPNNYMGTQNNGIQISYVNGLAGAKGYSMPPNTTMFLMDSDAPQFYVKVSDHNGMCTIKAYKFEEIQDNGGAEGQKVDMSVYVTKQEFEDTLKQIIAELRPKDKGGLI